jgi:hypothetical protein
MTSFAHRSKGRLRSYRTFRQMAVAISAFLSLGLLTSGEYIIMRARIPSAVAQAVPVAQSDDEIYTGSILYTPYDGRICRQILFDNRTGRSSDNGYVDCEHAAYRSASDKPSRVRSISSWFRR